MRRPAPVASFFVLTLAVDRGNWLTAFVTGPAIWRWMVANPQWGIKRVCDNCGAPFYDLNRSPATCPNCDTVVTTGRAAKPRREATSAPVIEKPETEASVDGKEVPGDDDEADDDKAEEAGGAAETDDQGDEVAKEAGDKDADGADDNADERDGSDRP